MSKYTLFALLDALYDTYRGDVLWPATLGDFLLQTRHLKFDEDADGYSWVEEWEARKMLTGVHKNQADMDEEE